MRAGRAAWLAALLALAGGFAFAEEGSDPVTDPGARFAEAMFDALKALPVPCPMSLTDGLAADRRAHCAKLRQDEATFRKNWKRAVRRAGAGRWRPMPVSAWQEDPGLITRYYDLDYVQVVAIFDTETRALMIVQERVGPCPDFGPADESVAHEACLFDADTGPEDELACPLPAKKVNPEIPDELRMDIGRRSGEVVATLSIDARGALEGLCIVSADPPRPAWIRSAIQAFREWRFEPATRNGEPVPVRRTLKMTYSFR